MARSTAQGGRRRSNPRSQAAEARAAARRRAMEARSIERGADVRVVGVGTRFDLSDRVGTAAVVVDRDTWRGEPWLLVQWPGDRLTEWLAGRNLERVGDS